MNFFRTSVFVFVACGLALPADAATNGPEAFLRKIDRQLCVNFKVLKCHRGKRRSAVAPNSKRKVEKPVAGPKLEQTPLTPEPALKPEIAAQIKVAAVVPRLKPAISLKVAPPSQVAMPVKPQAPLSVAETPTDLNCPALLKAKGVDFDSVVQPSGLASCIVRQPVQLKSVPVNGVDLQMPDHPILNCPFALHFVSWLQELGGPAATAKEGFTLTEFYTGPGYQCRGRNGDSSAKISEHGYGNAVDVERLKFSDGRVFLVHDALDPASKAYDTLKAMRASACTRFTTVLGPGSNAAHREHFHFDLGAHGKSGTYRICE